MESKFNLYKSMMESIDYNQRNYDAYWGYASYKETESAYTKLILEVKSDVDLTEDDKQKLIDMIEDKIKKMPEAAEAVRKYEEELHSKTTTEAKERYQKLSFLKKIKIILQKKTPDDINFEDLDINAIENLYKRK